MTHPRPPHLRIEADDLSRPEVRELIADHLADMHATTPAESVHALGVTALRCPDLSFWTAWGEDGLLGCGGLKHLDDRHAEIKSMRTAPRARRRGVASRVLGHLVDEARARGYRRLSLETGAQPFFEPARHLYRAHSFVECPPFDEYRPDPNSVFFTRPL